MNYDKQTALRIKAWLMEHGLTENGTYGLMANIYCESGFRSNNLQNSYEKEFKLTDEEYVAKVDSGEYTNFVHDHAGFGICQWTFWSRKEALLNYAKSIGVSIGDETMQLEYLMYELEKKYPTVLNLLKTSNDERECAIRVMMDFERPSNKTEGNQDRRADYATQLKGELTMAKKKILLVSGHTPGYNKCETTGVNEGDLNVELAKKVKAILDAYADVDAYPYDRDMYKDNKNGCLKANLGGYDYIFEIHFNGFDGNAKGTSIQIHSNYKGGISVEQKIIDKVEAIGFKKRGTNGIVRRDNLLNMSTALSLGVDYARIETCFYDSLHDMAIYNPNKDAVAHAIAGGIVEGFGLGKVESKPVVKEEPKEEVKEEANIRYCVQVGSFSKKDNAEALKKKLKADGYEAIITTKTV